VTSNVFLQPGTGNRKPFLRQRDTQLQYVVFAIAFHVHVDRIGIRVHVLADYFEQFAAQ